VPTPVPIFDEHERRIFNAPAGQFIIVVEARPGLSMVAPATSLLPDPIDGRPDVWIQSHRNLGNGSLTVCDTGAPSLGGGGIPGVDPARFDVADGMVTAALNDFACRFDPNVSIANPCTIVDVTRDPKPISENATVQFCDVVAATSTFAPGDTVLTLTLRDQIGNTGPTEQIVVRVATPAPTAP
jgi:hypothetical protein